MPLGFHFSFPLLFSLHPHWEAKDRFESIHPDPPQEMLAQRAQRSLTQRLLFTKLDVTSNWLSPTVSPSFYYQQSPLLLLLQATGCPQQSPLLQGWRGR